MLEERNGVLPLAGHVGVPRLFLALIRHSPHEGEMMLARLTRGKTAIAVAALSGAMALGVASSATASTSHHPAAPQIAKPKKVTWRYGTPGCGGSGCGQYLQISHASKSNGSWAQIRNGSGDKNEHWYSLYEGHHQYAFKNVNSGKCLNDRNGQTLGHVDQWGCGHFGGVNLWFEDRSSTLKAYALDNVHNGLDACQGQNRWVVFGGAGSGSCFWH
jgi:hypothetical protein